MTTTQLHPVTQVLPDDLTTAVMIPTPLGTFRARLSLTDDDSLHVTIATAERWAQTDYIDGTMYRNPVDAVRVGRTDYSFDMWLHPVGTVTKESFRHGQAWTWSYDSIKRVGSARDAKVDKVSDAARAAILPVVRDAVKVWAESAEGKAAIFAARGLDAQRRVRLAMARVAEAKEQLAAAEQALAQLEAAQR